MTLNERFGKTVRRLREKKGLSQERFAAQASISRGYMGRVDRGEVNPSLREIAKIAKALGLTMGQLMTEVEREKA